MTSIVDHSQYANLKKLLKYLLTERHVDVSTEVIVFGHPVTNDTNEPLHLFSTVYLNDKLTIPLIPELYNRSVDCKYKCTSSEYGIVNLTKIRLRISPLPHDDTLYRLKPITAITNIRTMNGICRELNTDNPSKYKLIIEKLLSFLDTKQQYLPINSNLNSLFSIVDCRRQNTHEMINLENME